MLAAPAWRAAQAKLIHLFGDEMTADKQAPTDDDHPYPYRKPSEREIKEMLERLYRSNKKIKGNIFRSMSHVREDYLLK